MSGKGGNKNGNTLEIFILRIIVRMAESKFLLYSICIEIFLKHYKHQILQIVYLLNINLLYM